jgi:IclR family transcriptional regulator, acetate operon repressor
MSDEDTRAQREPVARAIEVLSWMADHHGTPWGIRQVARDIGTSPSTVHRIFGIFEERGLLRKDSNGGYSPALALYRMCRLIAGSAMPIELSRPYLDGLAQECDETVMLGAYDAHRQEMMYIDVRQAYHPVQHIVVPNVWRPIYAGATGLAILAFLPEKERQAIYAKGLTALTDRTVTNAEQLEALLEKIRQAGYVRTRGHHTVGAVAVAAPVFDSRGSVFGDVCITIPDQRFQEEFTEKLGAAAMATAAAITEQFRSANYQRGFA